MDRQAVVAYRCDRVGFHSSLLHQARWLDFTDDVEMIQRAWNAPDAEGYRNLLEAFAQERHQPAGIIEQGQIVARATIMRHSDTAWELAAVWVDPAHRRRGYGASICSFITAAILDAGRLATCHTLADNVAMQRTLESIGYQLDR